jgi:signal transduction histidine kinase
MSVIHDVTRRKELEKEAVKAAKLSSITDMAYTLAHEIYNPLTGMKLGLSTLAESLEKKENIMVLESIMKDLNRIQTIVFAFLKARKTSSQMKKEEFSIIAEIIDDVLFHLSGQLDMQNISVDKQMHNEEASILISRDGIHQVLLNVLINAIQATPGRGKITIRTEMKHRKSKPFLCISLTDTGVGIEKSKCQEAFRPFYSSKPGGTGLGLSICKNIIASHEGIMELESDKGKGTRVNIFIPVIGE